jgi:hypothetical protein
MVCTQCYVYPRRSSLQIIDHSRVNEHGKYGLAYPSGTFLPGLSANISCSLNISSSSYLERPPWLFHYLLNVLVQIANKIELKHYLYYSVYPKNPYNSEDLCNISQQNYFLRWEVVSPTPNPQAGGLSESAYSLHSQLSSIHNSRTRHAVVTWVAFLKTCKLNLRRAFVGFYTATCSICE